MATTNACSPSGRGRGRVGHGTRRRATSRLHSQYRIRIGLPVGWAAKSARHAFLLSPLLRFFDWASCGRAADTSRIRSPNGSVEFRLFQRESRLTYSITFRNKPVIEASPLRVLLDGVDLADSVALGDVRRSAKRETYPWRGIHSRATNHYNVAAISLTHAKSRTRFTLEVRAFDNAVAFRHIIPGDAKTRVPDEATKFIVPPGSTVWHHDLEGHYEAVHAQNDVSQIKGRRMGGLADDFQAARRRRLRVDHRSGAGQLQRHGIASGRPPRVQHRSRPQTPGFLSVPIALQ